MPLVFGACIRAWSSLTRRLRYPSNARAGPPRRTCPLRCYRKRRLMFPASTVRIAYLASSFASCDRGHTYPIIFWTRVIGAQSPRNFVLLSGTKCAANDFFIPALLCPARSLEGHHRGNFGGIACWRDPVRALANIHHCLKPDGIFVLNHFDIDSVPGRILEDRHFEYNHASLVIYSKKTMKRCLNQARFDVVYSQNERQYASLGRIAGYLKQARALKALRALGLEDVIIPIIVPGTIFVICRKSAS
jgi:hypothetical protein